MPSSVTPPYGTTILKWDTVIPNDKLLPLLYKLLKPSGRFIIFGNEPFYSMFIYEALMGWKHNNTPKYWEWSHELIWIKRNSSNPLMANQQPLRYHEKIMILNPTRVGVENAKTGAYYYIQDLKNKYFSNLTNVQLSKIICNTPGATNHFFTDKLQWTLMPEKNYINFCSFIKQLDPQADLKSYDQLKQLNANSTKITYNPYTARIVENGRKRKERFKSLHHTDGIRGNKPDSEIINKTNMPRSYCVFKNDYNKRHPTAKPLALMKHIVKLYTNEYDIVLDFTMGSGTTGRACVETNRHFIGIEINEQYYNYASEWLAKPVEPEPEIINIFDLEKGGD